MLARSSRWAACRTALFVPLRKDDDSAWYIIAHRQEVQPFTDKQIALLQNLPPRRSSRWRTRGC